MKEEHQNKTVECGLPAPTRQAGSIVIQVLAFASISILILSGFIGWGVMSVRVARHSEAREQAIQIAEAGLDYYRWHLAHDPTDFEDGTGISGQYIHDFFDKSGVKIGTFTLSITPPPVGSTLVTIRSMGKVLSDPIAVRTIQSQLGKPSFAKYAVASNDFEWEEGVEIFGPYHANGGVHFSSNVLAHNVVTSAPVTIIDPDYGNRAWGAYYCVSAPGCGGAGDDPVPPNPVPNPPPPLPSKPLVFAAGRQVGVPAIDFAGLLADLADIKTQAQAGGRYYAPSGVLGYHIILKPTGKFDIKKVTALVTVSAACNTNSRLYDPGGGAWSIQTETLAPGDTDVTFPANGLIFVEDNVWVDGTVNGTRVNIAVARFPDNPSTRANITVNADIRYTNFDGTDVIGLIAQNYIRVGLISPPVLHIDAVLMAQTGAVWRDYYPVGNCGATGLRTRIEINGSIISALRYNFSYWCGYWCSGYQNYVLTYDPNLLFSPPPNFPLTTDKYQVISWDEITSDLVSPGSPTSLVASVVTQTSATISWTAPTDNVGVTGYRIFRDGVQVGTSATTAFNDSGLTAQTTYNYTVSAYDAAWNDSPLSSTLPVTTLEAVPPSIPTGLATTTVTATTATISWTASTDNVGVTGYKIFRDSIQVGTSVGTSFNDSPLVPQTTYSYTVSAYDAAGNNSMQSSAISVTTRPAPIAWWKFDDGSGTSAVDASGNGHTGTLQNGPSWTTGQIGGAVNFDQTTYSRSITVDHLRVPNTNQTNFPVLVSGTYSGAGGTLDLRTVANGGKVRNANGYDVGFYTNSNCSTGKMNWETESYNSATGAVNYWVNVATLSHTVDTVFYLCYGNGAIVTDQSSAANVWDANYRAVYHMADNAANTIVRDSNAANNGTNGANTNGKTIAGKIANALTYNGSTDKTTTSMSRTTAFTWELWFKAASIPGAGSYASLITIDGSKEVLMDLSNSAGSFTADDGLAVGNYGVTGLSTDTWYHLVMVRTGNSATNGYKFYLNGVAKTPANTGNLSSGNTITLGYRPDNAAQAFNGVEDEVRISNNVRSADWIATEYNNQSSPSTFYSIGAEVAANGGSAHVAAGNVSASVKSVSFWMRANSTTQKLIDLNGTQTVDVLGGTLRANGFTSPTIYVDGVVAATVDTNWHHVVITTGTAVNANAVYMGKIGTGYLNGILDDVRVYTQRLTAQDALDIYNGVL